MRGRAVKHTCVSIKWPQSSTLIGGLACSAIPQPSKLLSKYHSSPLVTRNSHTHLLLTSESNFQQMQNYINLTSGSLLRLQSLVPPTYLNLRKKKKQPLTTTQTSASWWFHHNTPRFSEAFACITSSTNSKQAERRRQGMQYLAVKDSFSM